MPSENVTTKQVPGYCVSVLFLQFNKTAAISCRSASFSGKNNEQECLPGKRRTARAYVVIRTRDLGCVHRASSVLFGALYINVCPVGLGTCISDTCPVWRGQATYTGPCLTTKHHGRWSAWCILR